VNNNQLFNEVKNYEEDILSNNGVVQHIRSGDSL